MRLEPLDRYDPEPGIERRYLEGVIRRLDAIVGDDLDDVTAVALIYLVTHSRLECVDGFVINDERHLPHMIGWVEAGVIAACLSAEPVRDGTWWESRRFDLPDEAITHAEAQLETLLRGHPTIARVV